MTCIQGPNDDIVQPEGSEKLDWEVEVGLLHRNKAQRVSKETRSDVAGYCLANDVSERDWQANAADSGSRGKLGTFGRWPFRSSPRTNSPIREHSNLVSVNGMVRQKSNTNDMIFSVAEIVSHLSDS